MKLIPSYVTITVDLTSSKLSAEVGDEISGPFLKVIVDEVEVVENCSFGMSPRDVL